MLHKEIKTKAQAAKVAKELKSDLEEALEIYGSYVVKLKEYEKQYEIGITSPQSCTIITESCMETVREIIGWYEMTYTTIGYHLGLVKEGEEYLPELEIGVRFTNN